MPAILAHLVEVHSQLVEEVRTYLETLAAHLAAVLAPEVPRCVRPLGGGPLQAWEGLREQRGQAVILGLPQVGKTALLHTEGYQRAREQLATLWTRGLATVELPLFIPLKALAAEEGEVEEASVAFLKRHYKRVVGRHGTRSTEDFSPRFWAFVQERLRTGRCRLLLDALDAVGPAAKRHELWERLGRFVGAYPHCPVVLTSRKDAYRALDGPVATGPWGPAWELVALGPEEVQALFAQRLATRPALAQRLAQEWPREDAPLLSLAQVPLLGNIIWQAVWAGTLQLPVHRVELFQHCIRGLVAAWTTGPWSLRVPEDTKHTLLQYLARDRDFYVRGEISKAALQAALRAFLKTTDAPLAHSHEDIVQELSDAGILVQPDAGADAPYHFLHPRIQTYLATCALVQHPDWQETL